MENSLDSLGYWSRSDSGHLLPDTGLRSKTDDCGRDHFDYVSVSNLGHVAGNSTIARAGKLYWLVTCHLLIFGSFDALQTWMRTGFGGSRACSFKCWISSCLSLDHACSYQNRIKSFPVVPCHLGCCCLLRIGSITKL